MSKGQARLGQQDSLEAKLLYFDRLVRQEIAAPRLLHARGHKSDDESASTKHKRKHADAAQTALYFSVEMSRAGGPQMCSLR